MEIWDKQEGETTLSYDWFCKYRDYGTERSQAIIVQKYGRKDSYTTQLGKWSKKYNWVERVNAYDIYLEGKKRKSMEDERLTAAKKHIALAEVFYKKVMEKMKTLDAEDLSARSLKDMAEFAVKTERDALGIAQEFKVVNDVTVKDKNAEKVYQSVIDIANKVLDMRAPKGDE